jgi:hypothetical protein
MVKAKKFEDLVVWQKAHRLVITQVSHPILEHITAWVMIYLGKQGETHMSFTCKW